MKVLNIQTIDSNDIEDICSVLDSDGIYDFIYIILNKYYNNIVIAYSKFFNNDLKNNNAVLPLYKFKNISENSDIMRYITRCYTTRLLWFHILTGIIDYTYDSINSAINDQHNSDIFKKGVSVYLSNKVSGVAVPNNPQYQIFAKNTNTLAHVYNYINQHIDIKNYVAGYSFAPDHTFVTFYDNDEMYLIQSWIYKYPTTVYKFSGNALTLFNRSLNLFIEKNALDRSPLNLLFYKLFFEHKRIVFTTDTDSYIVYHITENDVFDGNGMDCNISYSRKTLSNIHECFKIFGDISEVKNNLTNLANNTASINLAYNIYALVIDGINLIINKCFNESIYEFDHELPSIYKANELYITIDHFKAFSNNAYLCNIYKCEMFNGMAGVDNMYVISYNKKHIYIRLDPDSGTFADTNVQIHDILNGDRGEQYDIFAMFLLQHLNYIESTYSGSMINTLSDTQIEYKFVATKYVHIKNNKANVPLLAYSNTVNSGNALESRLSKYGINMKHSIILNYAMLLYESMAFNGGYVDVMSNIKSFGIGPTSNNMSDANIIKQISDIYGKHKTIESIFNALKSTGINAQICLLCDKNSTYNVMKFYANFLKFITKGKKHAISMNMLITLFIHMADVDTNSFNYKILMNMIYDNISEELVSIQIYEKNK